MKATEKIHMVTFAATILLGIIAALLGVTHAVYDYDMYGYKRVATTNIERPVS